MRWRRNPFSRQAFSRPPRSRLAMSCGHAGFCNHGAAHGRSRRRRSAGYPLLGCRTYLAAGGNDVDVRADERRPFAALAEADLWPTRSHAVIRPRSEFRPGGAGLRPSRRGLACQVRRPRDYPLPRALVGPGSPEPLTGRVEDRFAGGPVISTVPLSGPPATSNAAWGFPAPLLHRAIAQKAGRLRSRTMYRRFPNVMKIWS